MAERIIRLFLAILGMTGILILLLPRIGITVDVVMSGSMEPTLPTGGIVFTDTRQRNPRTGDIITFLVGDEKVSHRVVGQKQQNYRTKGDANDYEDYTLVEPAQIVGKVIFAVPYIGYAAVFMRQKTVFAILAVMLIQEIFFLILQNQRSWKLNGKERA